jgi:hypothetical protein
VQTLQNEKLVSAVVVVDRRDPRPNQLRDALFHHMVVAFAIPLDGRGVDSPLPA